MRGGSQTYAGRDLITASDDARPIPEHNCLAGEFLNHGGIYGARMLIVTGPAEHLFGAVDRPPFNSKLRLSHCA